MPTSQRGWITCQPCTISSRATGCRARMRSRCCCSRSRNHGALAAISLMRFRSSSLRSTVRLATSDASRRFASRAATSAVCRSLPRRLPAVSAASRSRAHSPPCGATTRVGPSADTERHHDGNVETTEVALPGPPGEVYSTRGACRRRRSWLPAAARHGAIVRDRSHPTMVRPLPLPTRSWLRRSAAVWLPTLLLLTPGCSPGDAVQDVALRLGPASFGRPASFREAVVQIGDEARPVLDPPVVTVLAERRDDPDPERPARVTIQLAPEARAVPDRAFRLAVKQMRSDMPHDEIAVGAAVLHFVQRDRGWRLLRARGRSEPRHARGGRARGAAGLDARRSHPVDRAGRRRARRHALRRADACPPAARLRRRESLARGGCGGHDLRRERRLRRWRRADAARAASGPRAGAAGTLARCACWTCRARARAAACDLAVRGSGAGGGIWAVPIVLSRPDRRASRRAATWC